MIDKGETRSGCREGRVSFIDISQIGNSQIQNTSARKHVSNILQYYNERFIFGYGRNYRTALCHANWAAFRRTKSVHELFA